jgi:hypothetical protein
MNLSKSTNEPYFSVVCTTSSKLLFKARQWIFLKDSGILHLYLNGCCQWGDELGTLRDSMLGGEEIV